MCGFAGIINVSRQGFSVSDEMLRRMQERLAHRGPDAHRTWKSDDHSVGLAFNRLKIIDLSDAAMQPMMDHNQSVIISFNGEIYNYQKVRKELEGFGHKFFSHSDTEVIINGYKEWGIDVVYKLEGMFAFALYDLEMRALFVVRDRIGVKPVYFSLQGGTFCFASEIKALWEVPWVAKEISSIATYHYLTFMVTPAPYTIYEQVYKLPAGFFVKVDAQKRVTFTEWYTPVTQVSYAEKREFADENFCTKNIEILLTEATEKRMISDVPFGAFLSGGVDSSLNVALMSRFVDRVKTFTVAFDDGHETNELEWARLVSKRFGTEHHELVISEKEAFEFYEEMVYHLDEPLADSVCIPFYFVSKLAKQMGVTVAQVGEGADELFFGYHVYAQYKKVYDRLWNPSQKLIPNFIKKAVFRASKPLVSNLARLDVLSNWSSSRPLFWSGAVGFNELQKKHILQANIFKHHEESFDPIINQIYPGLRQTYDASAIVDYHLNKLKHLDPEADFCKQMLYLELKHRLPELLLMRADKMSMAASVEAREPFLDHKLVEFMLHVPGALKFKNNTTKYLLKKVCQGVLPDVIVNRKKVGFAAPTTRWFTSGKYFPQYFKQLSMENRSSHFFMPAASSLDKLYHGSQASLSVQQWILQNIWALR